MKQVCIALNCPKGGVGKSTLSKEIATAYSLTEIGGQKPSVCIIDANIDFGDISSMLKIPPSKIMLDWATDIARNGDKDYTFEELSQYIIETPLGIYVVPASSSAKENDIISYHVMRTMIRNIKNYFDIVIIDTGNNTFDYTVACFEQANTILIVVTDESTSINCAVSLFKTFEGIGISMDKVEIIVNKYYTNKADRCFTIDEIEEVVGGIYATIAYEEEMPKINSNGVPAMLNKKENQFKKDIAKLAKKLLPDANEKMMRNGGN